MSASIPVFSDRPKAAPTPKLRALVKYPGNIVGGTGIDVTKQNGTVTVDMNWSEFGSLSAVPTSPTNNVLTFDTATQQYVMIPSSLLGGEASSVADAPINGTTYGRNSAAWTRAVATTGDLMTGTLSIAPPTLMRGLDIGHAAYTTPSSTSAFFFYNNLSVIDTLDQSPGGYGATAYSLEVEMQPTASSKSSKGAIRGVAHAIEDGINLDGDLVGVQGGVFATKPGGGVPGAPKGNLYGMASSPIILSGATDYNALIGLEINTLTQAGSSVKIRWGLSLDSEGPIQGYGSDAAIAIWSSLSSLKAWQTGILFADADGSPGLSSDATGLNFQGTHTIETCIYAPNYTFSQHIFNFSNFKVTGTGSAQIHNIFCSRDSGVTSGLSANIDVGYTSSSTVGIAMRPSSDTEAVPILFQNTGGALVGDIVTTATGTSYLTVSDASLKEDLKAFDAGRIVDDTEVYDFKWKTTGERSYGVIAQQANEVYPNAIQHLEKNEKAGRDEFWGVDYSKYVPVLLQELKALRARVAELEDKLSAKPS